LCPPKYPKVVIPKVVRSKTIMGWPGWAAVQIAGRGRRRQMLARLSRHGWGLVSVMRFSGRRSRWTIDRLAWRDAPAAPKTVNPLCCERAQLTRNSSRGHGGGITALAAAHRLWETRFRRSRSPCSRAGPRLGGVLETVRRDGLLIERSADNFIHRRPLATDCCRRIGFYAQLIPRQQRGETRWCRAERRLERISGGFSANGPVAASGSW